MHAESETYKLYLIEMMFTCFQIPHKTQIKKQNRQKKRLRFTLQKIFMHNVIAAALQEIYFSSDSLHKCEISIALFADKSVINYTTEKQSKLQQIAAD